MAVSILIQTKEYWSLVLLLLHRFPDQTPFTVEISNPHDGVVKIVAVLVRDVMDPLELSSQQRYEEQMVVDIIALVKVLW